jgi:glutaredoxin
MTKEAEMTVAEALEHLKQLIELNDYKTRVDCPHCQQALSTLRSLQSHYDAAMFNWGEVIKERDALKAEVEHLGRQKQIAIDFGLRITMLEKERDALKAEVERLDRLQKVKAWEGDERSRFVIRAESAEAELEIEKKGRILYSRFASEWKARAEKAEAEVERVRPLIEAAMGLFYMEHPRTGTTILDFNAQVKVLEAALALKSTSMEKEGK